MPSVVHYCQKCLGANRLGAEHCARCGTRLMLIVEPPTARFDARGFDTSHEEHLLERISALENRLIRLTDKLGQSVELVLKHARNTYFDHTLIQTLIGILHEAGAVDAEAVYALWRERCERDARRQDESDAPHEQLRDAAIAAYKGTDAATFGRHVDVSLSFLGQGDEARAIRSFERALKSSPYNTPLCAFLGQHYFQTGKTALAVSYLEKVLAVAPETKGARLLLGLAYADEGEFECARECLSAAAESCASFAAHYGLGRLLALEEKWPEALAHFKCGLAARPSPEAHYVVGSVYYQMKRDRMALRHLRKAIEADERYAEALYLLGLVHLRAGDGARAAVFFQRAQASDKAEPRYRAANVRRLINSGEAPDSSPVFHNGRRNAKKTLTNGDGRLAQVLRADALRSCTQD